MSIKDWSTTPADNNAAAPVGAPEGMQASDVNNVMRQMMADIKDECGLNVDLLADMTALLKARISDKMVVNSTGGTLITDGGGGYFRWDVSSTAGVDGDVLAANEGGAGRWIRVIPDNFKVNDITVGNDILLKADIVGTGDMIISTTGGNISLDTDGELNLRASTDIIARNHMRHQSTATFENDTAIESNLTLSGVEANDDGQIRPSGIGRTIAFGTSPSYPNLSSYGYVGYYFEADNHLLTTFNSAEGGTTTLCQFATTGNIRGSISITGSTTSYNTTSDPRLKTPFEKITGALDMVEQSVNAGIIGRYQFKDDLGAYIMGYNAHKLIDMQPNLGGSEGKGSRDAEIDGDVTPASVDPSKRVAMLEMAIFELLERIKGLENK